MASKPEKMERSASEPPSRIDRPKLKAAKVLKSPQVFDVPVVLTALETKSFSGKIWCQIKAVFPDH